MELNDKRIIVTGASSGIGLELVKRFLAEGAMVVAAARGIERIDLVHRRLLLKKCDVSLADEVDRLFSYALETMGGVDIFIANAGFGYCEKIGPPDWDHITEIFDTNVTSLFYAAAKMKELHGKEPYQFIALASGASFIALPGYALYCGTKAAIRGFADAYRYELEEDQLFQMVYPVATRTNFFVNAGGSMLPWPVQSVETVANAIISGIKGKKKSIYPSKLYRFGMVLNRIVPFVSVLYIQYLNKRFQRWLKEVAKG